MSFESGSPVAVSPTPPDSVSRVSFSRCGTWLLVAGWSGELGIYSPVHGTQSAATCAPCAVLDAAWAPDSSAAYAAGLDGNIYAARLAQASFVPCAPLRTPHAKAASCVLAGPEGTIISGSWDATVRIMDPRGDSPHSDVEVNAGAKVFSMCTVDNNAFAFVTSDKRARVVDMRNTSELLHDIAPSFGAPLRVVDASPERRVLVIGSTDGRVVVETLDEGKSPSFAFKCHRVDGRAYPVNAIAHNRKYGTFATGGGDGHVNVWDGVARKRIYQYPCAATSIASLDFSPTDQQLAVAVSYTFEEGERDHPQDAVYIRAVTDPEIRSRDGSLAQSRDKASAVEQGPGGLTS